jgi:hypothetical protein
MNFVGSYAPYTKDARLRLRYLHTGQSLDYLLWSPVARDYQLSLRAEAGQAGNSLQVSVDNRIAVPEIKLPASGWGFVKESEPYAVRLSTGFHNLRIRTLNASSGFRMDSLVLH